MVKRVKNEDDNIQVLDNDINIIIGAIRENDIAKVSKFLIAGVDPKTIYASRPLLHHAILNHHPGMVKLLLQAGSDANQCDKPGNNAIWLAVKVTHENRLQIIQILLKFDADVYLKNAYGISGFDLDAVQIG